MKKNTIDLTLNAATVEYLKKNLLSLPTLNLWFVSVFDADQPPSKVSLTVEQAKCLGDELTVLLAQRGFDEQYALNPEGELLESLIDACFYE